MQRIKSVIASGLVAAGTVAWGSSATVEASMAGAAANDSVTRTLESVVEIDAPIETVWSALTDVEVLRQWMAPLVEIDLRVGGLMKSNYNADGTIDDPTSIVSRIISFQAPRMLSLQSERIPEDFPFPKEITEGTWSVFLLDPIGARRTRVTCTGLGYGDDELTQSLIGFFRQGNEMLLGMLKRISESVAPDDHRRAPVGDELRERWGAQRRLIGEWQVQGVWADGTPLRSRESFTWTLGGRAMRSSVWTIAPDGTESQLYEAITFPVIDADAGEAAASKWRMWSFSADGTLVEVDVVEEDADTLIYPPSRLHVMRGVATQGTMPVRQRLLFRDDDTFRWTVWQRVAPTTAGGDESWTELIDADWVRSTPASRR